MRNLKHLLVLFLFAGLAACNEAPKETAGTLKTEMPGLIAEHAPEPEVKETLPLLPLPAQAKLARQKSASASYRFEPSGAAITAFRKNSTKPEPAATSSRKSSTTPEPAETVAAEKTPEEDKQAIGTEPEPKAAPAFASLQDLYRHLDKPAQVFTFRPKNDTVFTGEEGTSIAIPADAFVSEATGQPVYGPVRLELKEYYTIADMLLANLSTRAGNDLLETGGMILLEAYAGNEKLKLRSGKQVDVAFPVAKPKRGMEMFNGERKGNRINWVAALPRSNGSNFRTAVTRGGGGGRWNYRRARFRGGEAAMVQHITQKYPFPVMGPEKKRKGTGIYEFTILPDGTTANIVVVKKVDPLLNKAAVHMIATMPKWKPARMKRTRIEDDYRLVIDFNRIRIPETESELAAAANTAETVQAIQPKYKIIQKGVARGANGSIRNLTDTDSKAVSNYLLSSSSLGWMNCDRYLKPQPLYVYSLKTGLQEDTDIKLIMHKYNAILDGHSQLERVLLSGVPAKEKATVVVLKKSGQNLYLATQELVTTSAGLPELAFQEVSFENLKQELTKLNRLQR